MEGMTVHLSDEDVKALNRLKKHARWVKMFFIWMGLMAAVIILDRLLDWFWPVGVQ